MQVTATNSLVSDELYSQLLVAASASSFRNSGWGINTSMWETVMSGHDRFGINPIPPNHEVVGLTFITRPKLNLTSTSLKQDRVLSTFDTTDPDSLMFALRCYLDTKFSRGLVAREAALCPFFADDSPFILPLCNSIESISGFPDFIIDTETTSGGFFGEDIAFARGSEMNYKAFDIEVGCRDIQGGIIAALFLLWERYIALVAKGYTTAYPEDIIARRINYTCSIYRFVLDPSLRYITKWAKATGCFPQSFPIGNFFNFDRGQHYIHASENFSIPFKVNVFEAMDPIILREFNSLILEFSPSLLQTDAAGNVTTTRSNAPPSAQYNFCGIPLVDTWSGTNELLWLCEQDELEDPTETIIRQITDSITAPTSTGDTVQYSTDADTGVAVPNNSDEDSVVFSI